MSHYDTYPYPAPGQYLPDDLRNLRTDRAPRRGTWDEWFPGQMYKPKRVLVIGCGVYEAIAVAAQEPLLNVTAIDSSKDTIILSAQLAKGIDNLSFMWADIMHFRAGQPFDFIIASGVMHHIEDDEGFARRVAGMLKPGGILTVMVYGDCYREFVPRFCRMLSDLGVQRDAEGIRFVRELISALPEHHPVKKFMAMVKDNDSQIIDLWLHPYFHQYSADELIELMENHGLKFNRWLDEVTDYSWAEPLLTQAPAFQKMTGAEKSRVGQILNHVDAKLQAVFVRE